MANFPSPPKNSHFSRLGWRNRLSYKNIYNFCIKRFAYPFLMPMSPSIPDHSFPYDCVMPTVGMYLQCFLMKRMVVSWPIVYQTAIFHLCPEDQQFFLLEDDEREWISSFCFHFFFFCTRCLPVSAVNGSISVASVPFDDSTDTCILGLCNATEEGDWINWSECSLLSEESSVFASEKIMSAEFQIIFFYSNLLYVLAYPSYWRSMALSTPKETHQWHPFDFLIRLTLELKEFPIRAMFPLEKKIILKFNSSKSTAKIIFFLPCEFGSWYHCHVRFFSASFDSSFASFVGSVSSFTMECWPDKDKLLFEWSPEFSSEKYSNFQTKFISTNEPNRVVHSNAFATIGFGASTSSCMSSICDGRYDGVTVCCSTDTISGACHGDATKKRNQFSF